MQKEGPALGLGAWVGVGQVNKVPRPQWRSTARPASQGAGSHAGGSGR